MPWYDEWTIPVGRGQRITPFWHCFGANACRIERQTIIDMLMISKTALLPVNTHDLYERGLIIGNGIVRWDDVKRQDLVGRTVPCLNINLRTSAEDAIEVTLDAFDRSGIDLLKLEVLREDDMSLAHDEEVVKAARVLSGYGFRIMPLITANLGAARELAELGCPVIRVQGSPIGSGRGIDNPDAIREIARSSVPTILDCGIGSIDHIRQGFELGCAGFLVDWLLFKDGEPVEALRRLRADLDGIPKPIRSWIEPEWDEWFTESRTATIPGKWTHRAA